MQHAIQKYRSAAIWLHWIIAALVLFQIGLGLYMVDLPRGTDTRSFFFNLHKSMGVTIALFIIARILYRLRHSAPVLPAAMAQWEQLAARWSHRLLYLCMVVMPISGYVASSFSKYGVKFWGLALPNWGWEDKERREFFVEIHEITAFLFIALILLHLAAALKHLLIDKDGVFQRMLP